MRISNGLVLRSSLALILTACMACSAHASLITVSGTDADGRPISASADITLSYNAGTNTSTIQVTLTNLTTQTLSAAELLTGVVLPNSSAFTTASITGRTGTLINVAGDGTGTIQPGQVTDWLFENVGGLNALTFHGKGSTSGSKPPDDGIIGPAMGTVSGKPWWNANSSIAGSSTHNPFIYQSATFTLTTSGLYDMGASPQVTFLFGTDFAGSATGTPEPATMALLAAGGLVTLARRHFRPNKG